MPDLKTFLLTLVPEFKCDLIYVMRPRSAVGGLLEIMLHSTVV